MEFARIGHMSTKIEDAIRDILFQIGKEIKIHKVDGGNMIIEIDYEKYVIQIKELFEGQT